jgi:hypothetical protein
VPEPVLPAVLEVEPAAPVEVVLLTPRRSSWSSGGLDDGDDRRHAKLVVRPD